MTSPQHPNESQVDELLNGLRLDHDDSCNFYQSIEGVCDCGSETEARAAIENLLLQSELYGRLHENIEQFHKGILSADKYSKRHAEIVKQLEATKEV